MKRRRSRAALLYFAIEFMLGTVKGYVYVLWEQLARVCGTQEAGEIEKAVENLLQRRIKNRFYHDLRCLGTGNSFQEVKLS